MKIGIAVYPADFAMRPDALALAVEHRGFESLLFTEHTHLPATPATKKLLADTFGAEEVPPYGHMLDLFVAIALAAAATTTLRVGSGVCLVPQREPIAAAKAFASLDVLGRPPPRRGGRRLAAGRGGQPWRRA